ncbi:MAG TPA: hypothetical protein VFS67_22730 [Polyangiaceae bacterium]|jgi:hypothetical protein|nr:hypothetical protein [Polyangiaceae bacterium]
MFIPATLPLTRLQHTCVALLAAGLLTASAACTGEVQLRTGVVYDYPVAFVNRPPPRYWYYPHREYRGRPAYLIRGRWYYSTPHGWAVFRREPAELRRYRERRSDSSARRASPPRYLEPQRRARPGRDRAREPTEVRRRRYRD